MTIRNAYRSLTVIPALTAAANTGVQVNLDGQYLAVVISTTTASAGNTVTVTIKGVSKAGYKWTLLASATINSNTVTVLRVGPGLPATANVSANDVVPATVEISTVIAGTVAYGVDLVTAQ